MGLYCLAGLMALAAACSLWNRQGPVDRDKEMKRFTHDGGYAGQDFTVSSTRETWPHDDIPIEVSIAIPNAPGKLPVVVYLPGTGEDTEQGALWRGPWAQAGFAVVTIQPKEYGEALWARQKAKPGDFKAVGRTVFSRHSLENRVSQVRWTLDRLAARIHGGNGRYANLDMGRMALVGYDLGAQTALAWVGEKTGLALPAALPQFRAAIVISPHADPAWENVAGRYADIRLPLLLVGSEQDHDPAKISTPESRKSIWNGMPPGDKHLLLFARANHRLLSGTMNNSLFWSEVIGPIIHERGRSPSGDSGDYDGKTGATSSPGKGWLGSISTRFNTGRAALDYDAKAGATSRGEGGGGGNGRGSGNPMNPDAGGGGRRERNWDEEFRQEELAIQTHAARQMAIVVSVTTAFLDATLKESQDARDWLADDAQAWLKEQAEWLHK